MNNGQAPCLLTARGSFVFNDDNIQFKPTPALEIANGRIAFNSQFAEVLKSSLMRIVLINPYNRLGFMPFKFIIRLPPGRTVFEEIFNLRRNLFASEVNK